MSRYVIRVGDGYVGEGRTVVPVGGGEPRAVLCTGLVLVSDVGRALAFPEHEADTVMGVVMRKYGSRCICRKIPVREWGGGEHGGLKGGA